MSRALQVSLQQTSPIALEVELVCQPGEMLALVGPSGSGKSTVLRTIAGLQSVEQARVSCNGQRWLDTSAGVRLSPQERRIGMVFQHYALFPHKSALENVMLAVQNQPAAQRRQQALEWLARTNMTGLENRRPKELSGGQRQRVALARALAREPTALLLDEPFSAVDQQTRRKLYRELAQLRTELDIPILLVTHDISEVQQLADSLSLIHRGRTLQQGQVQQMINAPRSKEIAKLLGHQNLLSAQIIDQNSSHTTYGLQSEVQLTGQRSELPVGTTVVLLIAPTSVSIHGSVTDDGAANMLRGVVSDAVGLGDELSIRLHLDTVAKALRFRIPLHNARELGIKSGMPLGVTIRESGIYAIAANAGRT